MDICRINADGTGETRLLSRRDYDSHPVVSPDAGWIAFVAASNGNPEIYIMKIEGSHLFRLTRHAASDRWPEWSPDGTNLIFSSDRSGTFALYEIDVPGI